MADSWDEVTYIRKRQPKASQMRSQQAVTAAQRSGADIETSKKWSAGQNKQHLASKDTAKLDRETEELHHSKVGHDVGVLIQQGRQAKKWTQKDLAQRINEKGQVINDYESGKAIPNPQIMTKLERSLGIKLRGKDKGQPLGGKDKSGGGKK